MRRHKEPMNRRFLFCSLAEQCFVSLIGRKFNAEFEDARFERVIFTFSDLQTNHVNATLVQACLSDRYLYE